MNSHIIPYDFAVYFFFLSSTHAHAHQNTLKLVEHFNRDSCLVFFFFLMPLWFSIEMTYHYDSINFFYQKFGSLLLLFKWILFILNVIFYFISFNILFVSLVVYFHFWQIQTMTNFSTEMTNEWIGLNFSSNIRICIVSING